MLRFYLLSKLSVIKGLTLTFFVMVFFIPQDVFAAAPVKDTAKYISFYAVLIALVISVIIHVLFVRRSKGNIEVIRKIFSTAPQSADANVIITDAAWKIIYINPGAEQFLGLEKREALGMVLSDFFDKESLSSLYSLTDKHDVKSKNCISSKIKTKIGVWLDIASIAIPVKNPYSEEMGAVIILQPLEAPAESAAAAELSNFMTAPAEENIDTLTGLPNRKLLFEHLNSIIRDNAPESDKYALMLINLDFFRSINNNLGYEIGDSILKECAERLKTMYADQVFFARMDGDEFALIVSITTPDDIEAAANKVFEILEKPVIISGQEIFISASIGITHFPNNGKGASEVIRNAASTVNLVKNTRRGSYKVYTSDISGYNFQTFNIHSELRQALERKEFVLHYQPKVDSKTGQIAGIEALIRWNHPEKGLLYPIDFIPVAEETGIIKFIDEWVLLTACTQLKNWIAEGINNLRLSVNLSAWQFKDQHLVDTVSKVIAETGINPNLLELEITETAAIENLNFTQNTLDKLIKMGIAISIDDFGTGYSSLNYLKTFPVNFLKIDKSFVADIQQDVNAYSIVKAIIEVAHALKLKVIAEGVESQEQLTLLNKLGCDEIQGYLISRPLTVDDIKKSFMLEH